MVQFADVIEQSWSNTRTEYLLEVVCPAHSTFTENEEYYVTGTDETTVSEAVITLVHKLENTKGVIGLYICPSVILVRYLPSNSYLVIRQVIADWQMHRTGSLIPDDLGYSLSNS